MKELIKHQSNYNPSDQLLLYENSKLDDVMTDSDPSGDRFPATSDSNPVFLYNCSEPIGNIDDSPTKHHIRKCLYLE